MSESTNALTIGGEQYAVGLAAGGKLFVFTPSQHNFLLNLTNMKNVAASALSVGKDEEWGIKFLRSRKFVTYRNLRLQEISIRNGMTVDSWYLFAKWLMEGKKESWGAVCDVCQFKNEWDGYTVEEARKDDMTVLLECHGCYKPLEPVKTEEPFKPSREQVEGWKEIGSRIIPKIERIHHQFSNEEIIFESSEEK